MNLKYYIISYFFQKALQSDRHVLNAMMALLAKIIKMSWFDYPEMQIAVDELNHLFNVSNSNDCLWDNYFSSNKNIHWLVWWLWIKLSQKCLIVVKAKTYQSTGGFQWISETMLSAISSNDAWSITTSFSTICCKMKIKEHNQVQYSLSLWKFHSRFVRNVCSMITQPFYSTKQVMNLTIQM